MASDVSVSTADSFVASVASSFSHGSPYSSLASPCPSQQGFFDARCTFPVIPLPTSETRFGKMSPFWQYSKSLRRFCGGLI